MRRRSLISALPALFAPSASFAQDAASAPASAVAGRKVVVMSLIGDKLTYVVKSGFAGTIAGHNKETEVPMPGAPHDTRALQAIAAALPQADPGAAISFLAGSGPEFYADQDDWFDGDAVKLPAKLRQAVAGEQAGRLLLVTKFRGEAQISDGHASVGYGKLAGLGFYIYSVRERSSQESAGEVKGYIAPFVYARMSLIDLGSSRVIREQVVRVGTPYADLTPQGQLDALQALLATSLRDAVPQVVKAT